MWSNERFSSIRTTTWSTEARLLPFVMAAPSREPPVAGAPATLPRATGPKHPIAAGRAP
jgi:hypothetical protein